MALGNLAQLWLIEISFDSQHDIYILSQNVYFAK